MRVEPAGRARGRGQGLVETALILPVMLLLLLIVADFGRAFYDDVMITAAARQGARVGADYNQSDTAIRAAVKQAASPLVLADGDIVITPAGPRGPGQSGTPVAVTVSYPYVPLTPYLAQVLGASSLPITASASMVIF